MNNKITSVISYLVIYDKNSYLITYDVLKDNIEFLDNPK